MNKKTYLIMILPWMIIAMLLGLLLYMNSRMTELRSHPISPQVDTDVEVRLGVLCYDTTGKKILWDESNHLIVYIHNSEPGGDARYDFGRIDGDWVLHVEYTTIEGTRAKGQFVLSKSKNTFYMIRPGGKLDQLTIDQARFDKVIDDVSGYCKDIGKDFSSVDALTELSKEAAGG